MAKGLPLYCTLGPRQTWPVSIRYTTLAWAFKGVAWGLIITFLRQYLDNAQY